MKPKILKYMFRSSRQQPSRWLPETICKDASSVDYLHIHHLDSQSNITKLVYENERKNNLTFLSEGLIKTYPTRKFISYMKKTIRELLPPDLHNIRFSDIDSRSDDTTLISDLVDASEEHDGVSSLLAFLVPFKKDQDFKLVLDELVNTSYTFGYDFSSLENYEHDLIPNVDVFIVQFEARYATQKFELADTLLHISPASNLKKIAKQGLVPRSQSKEFRYRDRIYLFNKCPKAMVLEYARFKARSAADKSFCVFKIQKKNLVNDPLYKSGKLEFFVDMSFHEETSVDIEAVFTYNNIGLHLLDDECLEFADIKSDPIVRKFKEI